MPLKAKIQYPICTPQRSMATTTTIPRELPDDEPNDVLFGTKYGVRTIELNRPKKLNSLNGSMARKIVPRLLEWQKSQMANIIVVKGADRAFCAGGDVAALAKGIEADPDKGQQDAKDYFALEYQLDHLIATYNKPYVAFMDGITMGGGVGLSVHAPIRIATENTVFAMPETTIGFFPDVGASFFLPKMDGALGMYLALTSEQVKGVNVFYAGIATHYLDSSSLPDLEARLAELQFPDHTSMRRRIELINTTIEEFVTGIPHDAQYVLSGDVRKAIDHCFGANRSSLDSCLDALTDLSTKKDVSPEVRSWAVATLDTIRARSPTSVRITHALLQRSTDWDISRTFRQEYALASRFMSHPDFAEGVLARLVRKETPKWTPATLDQVSSRDVAAFFANDAAADELQLLPAVADSQPPYTTPPFASLVGLPRQEAIRQVVQNQRFETRQDVVNHFLTLTNFRLGVREKVGEVLTRCTGEDGGSVYWLAD